MAAGAGARPAPRWLRALWEPLSAAQLRRLEEHRYSAAGVSVLEPPLQRYWAWLLQWVPLWLAPNSITLLGLAINLLTTLLLIAYCPTATEEVGATPGVPFRPLPRLGGGRTPNCCPGAPRPPPAPPRLQAPGERETPAWLSLPGRRRADPATSPAPAPSLPGCLEAVTPPPQSRVRPEPCPGGGGAVKVTGSRGPAAPRPAGH